jgi:UDP-2-acetamido-2-deoxy-ribo-hexuluronate aminotransferase
MDLLVDVEIVLDVCAKRLPFYEAARDAIQLCQFRGARLWIYSGSVQTLEYGLLNELKRAYSNQGVALTDRQGMARTRELLGEFTADKHWLAAFANEGNVFAATDTENEQMLRALDRFPSDTVKLLTRDESLLESHPEKTISPERYCQQASSGKKIDFIDLRIQQDAIRPQLEQNIHRVLHHGQYIMGPEIKQLEDKLAAYVGVKHCITASSGTDTLLIAMMALGIGRGDEVITTPFTFVATGEMIALLGATPVFVDIDPKTYNIDPNKIEAAITANTKAIMPVSLYGQCADMDAINAIADAHGLSVIEDAAQSFGATYKGRKSCALSTIGSTSFFPSKPLGGYGEGGALFTDDDALAKAMREIRVHGQDRRYHHPRIGINGRLDTLQAAVLLAKLDRFDWEVAQRQKVGAGYTALLSSRCPSVITPYIEPHNTSVYAQYSILVEDRDAVIKRFSELGIPTAVHYPTPLNQQPAYRSFDGGAATPVSNEIASKVMSLPMGPDLSATDQQSIVEALNRTNGARCAE